MNKALRVLIIGVAMFALLVAIVRIPLLLAEKRANAVCDAVVPGMSMSDLFEKIDAIGYREHVSQMNDQLVLATFKSTFMEKYTCVVTLSSGKVTGAEVNYAD